MAFIVKRDAVVIPAGGFPDVASTNQIAITNVVGTLFGVANNGIGTYTKNGVFNGAAGGFVQYAFDLDGNALISCTSQFGGEWILYSYNGDNTDQHSINLSSNPAIIPTIGWSPSITITAA